jgi:ketosteroid isomerase-like protein
VARLGAPLALSLAAACARPAAPAASADAAAIRAARAAQNRAIVAGDVERVAAHWTEDVTLRRGLGHAVAGRAAYRQLFETGPRTDSTVVYLREPADVEVSARWPLAFETGTWTSRRGGPRGAPLVTGRYSAQWVKRDGRWLIRSEVFVALTCAGTACEAPMLP